MPPSHLPRSASNELRSVISHYSEPDYPTGIQHTLPDNFLKVTFLRSHRNRLSLSLSLLGDAHTACGVTRGRQKMTEHFLPNKWALVCCYDEIAHAQVI